MKQRGDCVHRMSVIGGTHTSYADDWDFHILMFDSIAAILRIAHYHTCIDYIQNGLSVCVCVLLVVGCWCYRSSILEPCTDIKNLNV